MVPQSVLLAHAAGDLSLLPRGGAACLLSRETPKNMKPIDRPKKVGRSLHKLTPIHLLPLNSHVLGGRCENLCFIFLSNCH